MSKHRRPIALVHELQCLEAALHDLWSSLHRLSHAQVAAVSGDVRRALELCRKAAEIAEEQQHASAPPASSSGELPPTSAGSLRTRRLPC